MLIASSAESNHPPAMNTRLPAAIEPLEPRIAPALVLTFLDVDGESATLTSTLGRLERGGRGDESRRRRHRRTTHAARSPRRIIPGATITTAVKRAAGGDGFVHIGRIDATGRDLGA